MIQPIIIIIIIVLAVCGLLAVVTYLAWVIVQQHYCAKLDAIHDRLPNLHCRQAAADSGPHETRWGYGILNATMTPRQMWIYLERHGVVDFKEQKCL